MALQRIVNTNIASLTALRQLRNNTQRLENANSKLASGKRILRSADDVSGFNIARRFESQAIRTDQALRNIQDGNSILNVADGALSTMNDALQRIRELLVGMSNDTNGPENRVSYARELRATLEEIDRQATASNFNGINLLDGTATNGIIQIGINSTVGSNTLDISSSLASARIADLNLDSGGLATAFITSLDDIYDGTTTQLNTSDRVLTYMQDVDAALNTLTTRRADIGAFQNRLTLMQENLSQQTINLQQSRSVIEDADIAKESAEFTQAQVLQQASVSILAQTNFTQESILSLLQR